MSLEIPDLDDRTYEELLEDARKRIPVHAPQWTDHNAHDPGITILELLAWLTETHGYQLDRVTDAHRRKFIDLVGVEPRPPQPATGALSIDVPDGVTVPSDGGDDTAEWVLPAGTPLVAETGSRERVGFETDEALPLTRAEIAAVVSEHERGRTDHTSDNETDGRSFMAFGRDAEPGSALYLGFDRDPFADAERLALFVEFHDEPLVGTDDRDGDSTFNPSLEIRWEYCTKVDEWYLDDNWESVAVVTDETNQFYRGGRVELAAPDTWQEDTRAAGILGRDEELFWLRGRVEEREPPEARPVPVAGPSSPALTERFAELDPCSCPFDGSDPPADRSESPARYGQERYELPPRLEAVRTNVVPARHRERDTDVQLERVDRGSSVPGYDVTETTGRPDQQFAFPDAPVETEFARGDEDDDGRRHLLVGEETWERVGDFDGSGPNDTHYVLDREAGVVQFGDGRRGAIPPVRRQVVATSVVYSGGPGGNVAAGSTWQFTTEGYRRLEITPRSAPNGGRGAESIPEAVIRAREARRVPHRAVTASDYRDLAARTPVVRVERAAAIAERCDDDAAPEGNHVTVVVIPDSPEYRRRAMPTRGFLKAVELFLCRRSLLSDRVSVVAPTYVDVRIRAEVSVADGRSPAAVRETAEDEVASFLDPLEGLEGDGWPFDRPVHESELYELLESLPGVEDAVDVSVAVGDGPDLATDRTALPYPESVTVTVREDRKRCGRGF